MTRTLTRRPLRGAVGLCGALGSLLLGVPSCTSPVDEFCGRMREEYQLDDLVTAIQRRDERRVTEGLATLRELQDLAPDEIHDDFRTVVDTVSNAVRAVTDAQGADGEEVPVDLTLLSQQLADIEKPAQHVADFADRNCGLKLNP